MEVSDENSQEGMCFLEAFFLDYEGLLRKYARGQGVLLETFWGGWDGDGGGFLRKVLRQKSGVFLNLCLFVCVDLRKKSSNLWEQFYSIVEVAYESTLKVSCFLGIFYCNFCRFCARSQVVFGNLFLRLCRFPMKENARGQVFVGNLSIVF